MIKGKKLEVAVFMEGINIPFISISVSSAINASSVATISIPYVTGAADPMYSTHVAIFYRYIDREEEILDSFKLLFHGEVASSRVKKNGISISWLIQAIDSRSYLNRMPSQYTWYLTDGDYPAFVEDYAFYGLPTDSRDSAVKAWYERNTMLLEAKTPSSNIFMGNVLSEIPKITSRFGAIRKNKVHEGTDYASPNGTALFCPFEKAIVTEYKYEGYKTPAGYGNYITIKNMDPLKKDSIRVAHLSVKNADLSVGKIIRRGDWLGKTGNSGMYPIGYAGVQSNYHVHVEYSNGTNVKSDISQVPMYVAALFGLGLAKTPAAHGKAPIGITMYGLADYINGLLRLLETTDKNHSYYHNANKRYKISKNFTVTDFGGTFAAMWGADCYNSFLRNSYGGLYKYKHSIYDNMSRNLYQIGYISYGVIAPKYDKKNNRLLEYFVSNDPLKHRPLIFNSITAETDDVVSVMVGVYPITAVKYRARQNVLTVDSVVSPPELHDDYLFGTRLTAEEQICGMNRVSKDMDYFVEAYMNDVYPSAASGASGVFQRMADYERAMTSLNRNTLEVTLGYLQPRFVVGLPGAVIINEHNREYYGVVQSFDLYVDMANGISQTRVTYRSPVMLNPGETYASACLGIDPTSDVDTEYATESPKHYLESFYADGFNKPISVAEGGLDMYSADEDVKYRDGCTLRNYLEMYKHKNISGLEGKKVISQFQNIPLSSDGAPPSTTLEENSKQRISIDKIGDLYIRERYDVIEKIASMIRSQKIIIGG